ncbi:MAG TPA: HAD family hydrolase [Vicinamibacterales bacterium]|nr:HAD family hydrolase [Vicinamibacterales bacterium]
MRAVIFDLDGTLVDTVYAHTFAWWKVLAEARLPVPSWKVHRLIGMSGGLITKAAGHEIGRDLSDDEVERLQTRHGEVYKSLLPDRTPLPGALDLLRHLRQANIKHAIATSGKHKDAAASLDVLDLPAGTVIVDRTAVERAKPEPDLFLACQEKLGVSPAECYVVGDAVWDLLAARRAGMLGIGLLSGGYGEEELARAGAYRVYHDPAELLSHIYQLGLRSS